MGIEVEGNLKLLDQLKVFQKERLLQVMVLNLIYNYNDLYSNVPWQSELVMTLCNFKLKLESHRNRKIWNQKDLSIHTH